MHFPAIHSMQHFDSLWPSGPNAMGKTKTDEILWEFFTVQLWKINSNPEPSKKLINGNISALTDDIYIKSTKNKMTWYFWVTSPIFKDSALTKSFFPYFYLLLPTSDPTNIFRKMHFYNSSLYININSHFNS